jgi:hypothetical protein
VKSTEFLNMQFFPAFCHFIPLRTKHSPQPPSTCVLRLMWQKKPKKAVQRIDFCAQMVYAHSHRIKHLSVLPKYVKFPSNCVISTLLLYSIHMSLHRKVKKWCLILKSPVVTICASCLNNQQYRIVPTAWIYVIHVILTVNSDYFLKQR